MEINKFKENNEDSQKLAELAQLEARVAELRKALGKGCVGGCVGCPYSDICGSKSDDMGEELSSDEEPGLIELQDEVSVEVVQKDDLPELDDLTRDHFDSLGDDIKVPANTDMAKTSHDISIEPEHSVNQSVSVHIVDDSEPRQDNFDTIIDKSPDSEKDFIEPPSPNIVQTPVSLSVEMTADPKTKTGVNNEKNITPAELVIDLPIRKQPTMDSMMPVRKYHEIDKPLYTKEADKAPLLSTHSVLQPIETFETSDTSFTSEDIKILIDEKTTITAAPAQMCKTSGELEKENIGNPYILNDGVESMLVSVENVDAVTEEDILEYSQRCELARRNVEIVYENLASSDGSDEIVYDDKVVVFRNNVDIDYSLTRVSQYSDIYVRYFRNITFVIARLALHLTCKVIGTPLTR